MTDRENRKIIVLLPNGEPIATIDYQEIIDKAKQAVEKDRKRFPYHLNWFERQFPKLNNTSEIPLANCYRKGKLEEFDFILIKAIQDTPLEEITPEVLVNKFEKIDNSYYYKVRIGKSNYEPLLYVDFYYINKDINKVWPDDVGSHWRNYHLKLKLP